MGIVTQDNELLPATLKTRIAPLYSELLPLHNWLRFSNSSDFLQIYVFTCSISEWRCLQMWNGEVWLVRNKSLQKIGTFKWKKRLELDSAAVGSVSGETVDRLASNKMKLRLYMLHTLGKVKNQEMPSPPWQGKKRNWYDIYKHSEDSESEAD